MITIITNYQLLSVSLLRERERDKSFKKRVAVGKNVSFRLSHKFWLPLLPVKS
jgi:hypothetical protein